MNDWLGSFYCLSFFALRLKTNPIPYTLYPKSKTFFVWICEFPFYDDGVCLSSGSVSGRKPKIVEFFVIIIKKKNNHSPEKPWRRYFDCLLSCFLCFFRHTFVMPPSYLARLWSKVHQLLFDPQVEVRLWVLLIEHGLENRKYFLL